MTSEENTPERDVLAFDRRANEYDEGRHGQLHHDISDRVVDLAFATNPSPWRVLDIGCGTGYVLKRLAARAPKVEQFLGIDPAPRIIDVARSAVDPHSSRDLNALISYNRVSQPRTYRGISTRIGLHRRCGCRRVRHLHQRIGVTLVDAVMASCAVPGKTGGIAPRRRRGNGGLLR